MRDRKRVVFTVDKNGRRIAYRVGFGSRLFRMGLAEAENAVSTGEAVDASDGWKNYLATTRRIREGGAR